MTSIKDAKLIKKQNDAKLEPVRNFEPATLIEINGDVEVADRPDYVWAQEYGQPQSVFQVLNRRVAPLAGLTVKVGYPEKPPYTRQVMDVWDDIGDLTGYEPGGGVDMSPHGQSHQYPSETNPGTDPVLIYQPALQMLKTTTSGSGLIVTTWPLDSYWADDAYQLFPGAFVNMAAHVPTTASRIRYALVYLDTATNTMVVVAGTEVVDTTPVANIPKPSLPVGAIPSAYILLTTGQTSIATGDILDARDFLGLIAAGNGWPFNIVTVDLIDEDADYSDLESAIAAISVGDVIMLGPGTFVISAAITMPNQSAIIGQGKDITTIFRDGSSAVVMGLECLLTNLTVLCENSLGNVYAVTINSTGNHLDNVRAIATSFVAYLVEDTSLVAVNNAAYLINSTRNILQDCDGEASAPSDSAYGILFNVNTALAANTIVDGSYSGTTADISDSGSTAEAQVCLVGARLENDTIQLDGGTGHYITVVGLDSRLALASPYVKLLRGKALYYERNQTSDDDDDSLNGHYVMQVVVEHSDTNWYPLELAGDANGIEIRIGESVHYDVLLIGQNDLVLAGGTSVVLAYRLTGVISNPNGTISLLVTSVTTVYEDDANFAARAVAVDSTTDYLSIQVTDAGGSGETIYWVANVRTSQAKSPVP